MGDHFSLDEINLVLRELKKPVDDRNYECNTINLF